MTIAEFIDRILSDTGEQADGTGFWTRTDVLRKFSDMQREISRDCRNIFASSATLEPAASATEVTIDANGNLLEILNAQRTYGGYTRPIYVYSKEQIEAYDIAWTDRTGAKVRGLITGIVAEGKARLFPIPDNANNDIDVDYLKIATKVTQEFVEAGDGSAQLDGWYLTGITDDFLATGNLLYWEVSNVTTTRTVKLYKASAKLATDLVAQGSRTGDGEITLTERNDSGISGTVTVAFTIDDTATSNTLTFNAVEIPVADVPCLEYAVKQKIYELDRDGKSEKKAVEAKNNYLAEKELVLYRARKRREGTYSIVQERPSPDEGLRTRPYYEWEV